MLFRGEKSQHRKQSRKTRRIGGLSICALLCSAAPIFTPVMAGEWHAKPSLEVAETYTDNVDLTPTNRKSDFITRISPGISLTGKSARVNLNVDYVANYLIFARDNENTDLRHNLNAGLNTELVRDWLYLDGRASINQQFLDRGGALSSNDANVTDNRQTVQTYSISPRIRHSLGSFANLNAGYTFAMIQTGKPNPTVVLPNNVIGDTLTQSANIGLDSGRRFARFKWGTGVDYIYDDRKDGRPSSEDINYRFYSEYSVNRWLRLVGSVGYEDINDNTLTQNRDGFTWDAGFTLTPGPRSELTVRGGRRYQNDNWSVRGTYRLSERSIINLAYTEEVTTSSRILQNQLVLDSRVPATDPGGFSLTNNAFLRKRAEFGITATRKRNVFGATAFHEKRLPDAGFDRETNYGMNFNFSRQLSRATSAFISGTAQHTKFYQVVPRSDDFFTGEAGFTYKLSEYFSGGVTYYYTNRNSSQVLRDLKENAVKVNLKATF